MLWLLDRATQLTSIDGKEEHPGDRQTTDRTIVAAE
jgi:hypothetical protein